MPQPSLKTLCTSPSEENLSSDGSPTRPSPGFGGRGARPGQTASSLSRGFLLKKEGKKRLPKLRMTWCGRVVRIRDYRNLCVGENTREPLHIRHKSVIGANQDSN